MKRTILTLIATFFTIAAFCQSCTTNSPSTNDCNFGFADKVYTLGNSLAERISPDCDINFDEFFEEAQICEYAYWQQMFSLYLKPVEGKYLCFRDVDYDRVGNSGGYIEKRVGDEWQRCCESGNAVGDYEDNDGWSTYPLRVDRGKTPNLHPYAPIFADPGEYRITMYFRDCDESGQPKDDAVHNISFEVSVPEHSGKPFDIIQAELSTDGIFPTATVLVRQNDSAKPLPYVDRQSFSLAYEGGGKPVEVAPREGTELVAFCPSDGGRDGLFAEYSFALYFPVKDFDISKTYRLTVKLTENEDGSGEQYTLTLNLRFDE